MADNAENFTTSTSNNEEKLLKDGQISSNLSSSRNLEDSNECSSTENVKDSNESFPYKNEEKDLNVSSENVEKDEKDSNECSHENLEKNSDLCSLENLEKNSNVCSPSPLEPCTNPENKTAESDGSADIYSNMPVIEHLSGGDDKNCEEITSDNKDYCSESFDNCEDGDSRDPAEICESTLEEVSANEPWIIVDSVEDDSRSSEECKESNAASGSFNSNDDKNEEETENLPCPSESSPCLITISEVRQNEPWLSDDSGSNNGKNSSPKEEFILAETSCKHDDASSDSKIIKEFKIEPIEETPVHLTDSVNCISENKNEVKESEMTEMELNNEENVLNNNKNNKNSNNQIEPNVDEKSDEMNFIKHTNEEQRGCWLA